MVANVQSMAYYGDQPWHGEGKKVEKEMTSAEAIIAAGLDWKVSKRKLYLEDKTEAKGIFATVRDDNEAQLGFVGKVYTVLQNKDAFSFFDAIVGLKAAMYHTAGALGNGERVWLMAKLPGEIKVTKDDVTEKFLLLSNSHDGGSMVQVMFTPIRVVCQNTLNMAIGDATNKVRIRHTINMGQRVEEIQEQLGIVNQHFDLFGEAATALAKVKMKSADLKILVKKTGLIPNETDSDMSTKAKNIMDEVSRLFEAGKGANLLSAKGTAWGAVNAVVEYVDHVRQKDDDARAKSQLFGKGSRIKQRAWDLALSTVKP